MQIIVKPLILKIKQIKSITPLLVTSFLFLAAFGIRLYRINEPPLNFHSTRQYRSMIIARGYFFDGSTSVTEWEKRVGFFSQQKQGILEPPIMEFLVSIGYRLLGGENYWLPKLLSSVFWLIGGGFLYLIGKTISNVNAALFSLAFYLFLPFGVIASRSFQPDPLMVMLMLASVYALLCYYEDASKSRLVIAALISALAFLVKPGSIFVIIGAFAALAISRQGIIRSLLNRATVIFLAITLTPTILFYSFGIYNQTFLVNEAQKTLLPQLWLSGFFWRGWINNIGFTVGYIPLVFAMIGVLLFRQGLPRIFMIGLWVGYFIFGLALNYNFATHNYYQLQFIPIIGLSIGPAIALLMDHLIQINPQIHWRIAMWGALALALLLSIMVARSSLNTPNFEYKVSMKQQIGELVNHSTNTIFLSSDYGVPLEYHGQLSGVPWPLASDLEWEKLTGAPVISIEDRFNSLFSEYQPEYFIVEDLQELASQPGLNKLLMQHFTIKAETGNYIIYILK